MSNILQPIVTEAGIRAMLDANNKGLTAKITKIKVGDAGVTAPPNTANDTSSPGNRAVSNAIALATDLVNVRGVAPVTGAEVLDTSKNQLHLTGVVRGEETFDVYEIGFYLEDENNKETLFAIYASESIIAQKVKGTDFMLSFDLVLTGIEKGNIQVDGSAQFPAPVNINNYFLPGEDVITIQTQEQFDAVFNTGANTFIDENKTIILCPIQGTLVNDLKKGAWGGVGNNPHNTYNGRPAYILKNSVEFLSNVTVRGFNVDTTTIVKEKADCYFNVNNATGINLEGWAFDGRANIDGLGGHLEIPPNVTSRDRLRGGFHLNGCYHSVLNCRIVNHGAYRGAGIFSEGVSQHVTAQHIYHCKAHVSGGGYSGEPNIGSRHNKIRVHSCSAQSGGGVDRCDDSIVEAYDCLAFESGGAAYESERVELTAYRCAAKVRGCAAAYCKVSTLMMYDCYYSTTSSASTSTNIEAISPIVGCKNSVVSSFECARTPNDTTSATPEANTGCNVVEFNVQLKEVSVREDPFIQRSSRFTPPTIIW